MYKMKLAWFLCHVFFLQIAFSIVLEFANGNESPARGNNVEETTSDIDLNNTLLEDGIEGISIPHPKPSDAASSPSILQNELHDVKDESLQTPQIHSSFEEVTKSSATKDGRVNDKPQILLNQGTISEDLSESGTLGILSASDSATAELKNRVVSMSTDFIVDKSGETTSTKNGSKDLPPPIVILPPGDLGLSNSAPPSDPLTKSAQHVSTSDASSTPDPSQPPVVRAEPKIVLKAEDKPRTETVEPDVVQDPLGVASDATPEVGTTSAPPTSTSNIDLVGVPTSESPHEEIPSFSEWTQKQLEEAEKKKDQNKTTSSSPLRVGAPSKIRSKNYASPDCGAKIIAANPEADNPNGVLSTSKDEYVLNKCTTQRKWLIIELCEPIQAKKLELANFELFSSSPKDFSVSLSHNHPSREWSSIGQFTARDERAVQSFNLHPHLFGKFLKVEFNTHYGNEHFCCTSLIRVYGTSEFEVLETESEAQDLEDGEEDEDEQPIGIDLGKPAKNLFGHATEAVYSIVKKAAEALVKSGDRQEQSNFSDQQNISAVVPAHSTPPEHCSTLRHLVVCNNCSEDFFDKVYSLLSCHPRELQALMSTPFVLDAINSSQLCSIYGLDFILKRSGAVPLRIKHEDQLDQAGYLAAMLPTEYISALCNILAVLEGKVVLNNSQASAHKLGINLTIGSRPNTRDLGFKKIVIEPEVAPTCSVDESFSSSHCKSRESNTEGIGVATTSPSSPIGATQQPSIASMIKPTKTLSKDTWNNMESLPPSQETQIPIGVPVTIVAHEEITAVDPSHVTVQPSILDRANMEIKSIPSDGSHIGSPPDSAPEITTMEPPVIEQPPVRETPDSEGVDPGTVEEQDHSKDLDAIIQEMKALDNNEEASTESNPPPGGPTTPSNVVTQTRTPAQQVQKESVFLRLSNRIKALERNMSLSGQYLEELSRRYKKQEELSRSLNKTLVLLHEEVRRSKEKEIQHSSDMSFLKSKLLELSAKVEALHVERDSWHHKAAVVSQHLIVIMVEVLIFSVVVWLCRRLPSDSSEITSSQHKLSSVFPKFNRQHGKPRRRNSYEGMRNSKELKKRRPSEELLYISGSCKDLLQKDDRVVVVEGVDLSPGVDISSWSSVTNRDQRRKRKRRKDFLIKSNSSENLAQLTSENLSCTRKISAPSHSFSLSLQSSYEGSSPSQVSFKNVVTPIPTSSQDVKPAEELSETADTFISCQTENRVANTDVPGMFPPFMETASSARSRRSFNYGDMQSSQVAHRIHDLNNGHDGESGSGLSHQSSHSRGLDDQVSEHTSSQSDGQDAFACSTDQKKKIGKKKGLKNMVKKFF